MTNKQSEIFRMFIIAGIGVVLGFLTYEVIYYFNSFSQKATLSWMIAFVIGIVRQHALHRYFTFAHKGSYVKSLYKAFVVDIGALVFSTVLHLFLVEVVHLHHRWVWGICLLSTALISLVFLKVYIFRPVKKS